MTDIAELLEAARDNPALVQIAISRELCGRSLAEFTKQAWHIIEPGTELIWNWHLDVLCEYIQAFFESRIRRLILNVPPGTMKSVMLAVMGPAWVWTWLPPARIVSLTNELGLATRDNRRMRQIIESEWYQARWPHIVLAKDQAEKTLYANTVHGFRQGIGMGGNITGKRGKFLLIDDPVDAKKAFSDVEIQSANETYDQAVSSRLDSPKTDGIALIMQRLRTNDLTGHLLSKTAQSWTHVRIAMEYEGSPGYDPVADLGPEYAHLADPRTEVGELMFPERFDGTVLAELKENLGEYGTAGQLQQRPSPLGGGILPKALWQPWPKEAELPLCRLVFSSMDTAFTKKETKDAAYTARTTWGLFEDHRGRWCIILLSAWAKRVAFPELRKNCREHWLEFQPDLFLVERKASGYSLLQELKAGRIPVRGFNPGKMDKVERAHIARVLFESKQVFYPEGKKWALNVIDHVADFPTGGPPSADYTDTVSQAVIWVKRKGWALPPDEEDEPLAEEQSTEERDEDASGKKGSAYG